MTIELRIPDFDITEQSRLLMAMHSAMRADSRRLRFAVGVMADRDVERANALGQAFALVDDLIHDHHRTEDDVIYPFLLERVPGFASHASQLEDDHVELDATMARISARLRILGHALTADVWRETHARLLDDACLFSHLLYAHLDREECVVLPEFESVLTREDHRVLRKRESKLSTYRHMKMAVPWVLANATPSEAATLRADAPRLLSVIDDRLWAPQFRRLMAPLYDPTPVFG